MRDDSPARRSLTSALLLVLLAATAAGQSIAPAGGPKEEEKPQPVPNDPPVISTDLVQGARLVVRTIARFHLSVTDPEGHRVSVRLLNPPPGIVFQPAVNVRSPYVQEVTWYVPESWGGVRRLVFEATDSVEKRRRTRFEQEVVVSGDGTFGGTLALVGFTSAFDPSSTWIGDVTGDGRDDVVAVAHNADAAAPSAGAVYVWKGQDPLSPDPIAVLTVPDASSADNLGREHLRLVDVTGDGVLDVVAGAYYASPGGVFRAGAFYVWKGGPTLAGPLAPTATLAGDSAGDAIGFCQGQGLYFADLTGDGVLDLVVAAQQADTGGVLDTGAILLWAGGAGLTGTPAPLARLQVPGAAFGDALGLGGGDVLLLGDVTGDGALDVVAVAARADRGQTDTGAIYVWRGPTWSGVEAPAATLVVPSASPGDALGLFDPPNEGFRLEDLTGDGVLDVLAGSPSVDVDEVGDVGAFYVWKGSADLLGTRSPTATLEPPNPSSGDRLGNHVEVRDVTGDGTVDLIVADRLADVAGIDGPGKILVWEGGSALVGKPAPRAQLLPPGAGYRWWLGTVILVEDVTGDGIADVLGTAPNATPVVGASSAVYLWAGGAGLTGLPGPTATLIGGASGVANLGEGDYGVQAADLDGDGVRDVVVGAPRARIGGLNNSGAICIWYGGSGLSGNVPSSATLVDGDPKAGERLPDLPSNAEVFFTDMTGDGVCDVVAGVTFDHYGALADTGAIFFWSGSPRLEGTVTPTAYLRDPAAQANDLLGYTAGTGLQLVDVNADGRLDVLAAAPRADRGGLVDTGVVFAWLGGAGLSGLVAPSLTFERASPQASDFLGQAGSEGVLLADVTADGVPDLVVVAPLADVGGVQDTGVIVVWKGPLRSSSPSVELRVPGASPDDELGD